MNTNNIKNLPISTVILVTVAFCLLASIPWLMQFPTVLDRLSSDKDVWDITLSDDPYYKFRLTVIIIGVVCTALSFIVLLISFFNHSQSAAGHLLNVTLFVLIWAIGFRSYGYFVNGLYEVFKGGSRTSFYDPKGLLPMAHYAELGEQWREVDLSPEMRN